MTLADSGALRVRRARAHKAGDHSLCRRCPAARGEAAPPPDVRPVPQLPAPQFDPETEMKRLAARLAQAHEGEPANALLARELRATLQALMGGSAEGHDSELAGLFSELSSS